MALEVRDGVVCLLLRELFAIFGSQLVVNRIGRHVHRLLILLCLSKGVCVPVRLYIVDGVLSLLWRELLSVLRNKLVIYIPCLDICMVSL